MSRIAEWVKQEVARINAINEEHEAFQNDDMLRYVATDLESGCNIVEGIPTAMLDIPEQSDELDELVGFVTKQSADTETEFWVWCDVCARDPEEYEAMNALYTHEYPSLGYYEVDGRKYQCPECKGKRGWYETRVNAIGEDNAASAYFTTTGDNPVLNDMAAVADMERSAGGWSTVEPDYIPDFYSHSMFRKGQHRAFLISLIRKTAKNIRRFDAEGNEIAAKVITDFERSRTHVDAAVFAKFQARITQLCTWLKGADEEAIEQFRKDFWRSFFAAKREGKRFYTNTQVSRLRSAIEKAQAAFLDHE